MKRINFKILLVFLAAFLFFPTQIGHAQLEREGLSMEIRAGFDGIVQEASWFPVVITLENNGAPIEGQVEATFGGAQTVWKTDVSLPTQSRKQINMTVYAQDVFRSFEVSLYTDDGERILHENSINLQAVAAHEGLIYGVVTSEQDALEVLTKVAAGRPEARVAYVDIDEIPTDPVALQALDMLVFNDVDTNGLSLDQRAAINAWIAQGGQLVITGGASWQRTTAAFADILPVEVTGTESVDQLAAFGSAIGEPFRDPGPYVVTRSSFINGELVWRNESLPILARRPLQDGNVWFLALDPQFAPLNDWDGSEILWNSVAEFIPLPMFWERGFQDLSSLSSAVSTIPAIQLPSVWLVLGFMVSYILIVGPINYWLLTRYERRELAWLTLPLTMIVFSIAALVIGLQFRGNRVVVNQLSIVQGRADADSVRVDTAVGVFSPRRDRYTLSLPSDSRIRYTDRFGFGGSASRQPIELGASNEITDLLIDVGDVSQFVSSQYRDASPITAKATLSAEVSNQIDLVVTNNTSEPIENILLLVGIKNVALFNIEPGETIETTVFLPTTFAEEFEATAEGAPEAVQAYAGATDGYTESPIENGYSTLIEGSEPGLGYNYYSEPELRQRYNFLSSLYQTYNSQPVFVPTGQIILIGWSEIPQVDISVDTGRSDQVASTLYFLEIPLTK
ncbi:MAG: hypothetical protein AAF902_15180 [Chloroflexota bacterium]